MKTENETEQRTFRRTMRRYVFTRMVPVAVIVFFILFTFYPRFGNPISNLRGLGGNNQLTSHQKLQQAEVLKLGLEQLQANGELGSYLQASGGGTNNQTLAWDDQNKLLSISDGNSVYLGGLVATTTANPAVQTLARTGNILTLSSGGSVDLSNYLDNTDAQQISLSGNTLSLANGGSVNLSSYLDNTDVLAGLSCSAGQLPEWNGSAWSCLTPSGGTDSQNLSWNGATRVLTITNGNTVDLTSLLDNTDSQAISKSGNTLSITGNASIVDLASYLDNTDAQTVGLAGSTLTISGGNSINLAPINTDSQTLSLGGSNLTISGGNTLNLASINTDVLAGLSCSSNQVAKWNGSAWACAADTDTNTDAQTLSLVGSDLSILSGNTINLASINTDALAALSCADGTIVMRVSGVWACGTDADTTYTGGTGITIDGSNVVSSVLGTDIASAEIVDGTIVAGDIANGTITNAKLATSSLTVAAGTGLTGGGSVNLGGTITLNLANDFGATIDSAEITDGTIATGDIANAAVTSTLIADGTIASIDLANGSVTATKLANCSSDGQILKYTTAGGWACAADADTTYSQGAGISISGGNVISSTLGTSIDSSEIVDGTIANGDIADTTLTFAKLAANSCGNGDIIKFNGSAWVCGTDNDTVLTEANVEAYIFDGDNTGTLSSGTLALSSLSYTGTLGDANISDALTISSSGSVDDGALSANVTKLGQTIDSGEITNGTILFADLAQNACTNNQVIKWDASANAGAGGWVCGTDLSGAGASNSFETVVAPSGTNPVADSSTDTLTLSGSGITITGNSTTDTLTFTLTNDFGASIDSSEITNGTIVAADIADGSLTLAKLGQNSCGDTQVIKWSSGSSAWVCANDIDTQLNEAQVDAYANNNGYLTSEVDGNTTNEIQDLSILGDTLSLSSDGSAVDLAGYLDNTDVLASLSCSPNQIAKWNGSAWACAADVDTVLNEAQVDSYVSNNGYLTSFTEVDGSTSNELQDLSLSGNTLTITGLGSPTNIDLAGYLDNTDALAALSCVDGKIVKRVAGVWACGDDTDTVLSEAQVDTYVSNNGYLTSEVDGSTTNELQNIFGTIATPDANNPSADTTNDTLTLANGSGVNITSNGTTDTITIAATLGTSIDSSEIVDGTIANGDIADATLTFSKLASNSCGSSNVIKFNGSAWVCGTDNDTILSEATVESYIFDADNTGTLSSGTLALSSLSYTGTLGDTNISDALTISSSGSVADGALSSTVTKLGQTIESGEITDGTITGSDLASATIQFSNIAQNGCTNNEIMKWNGSAWACAADTGLTSEVDGSTTNELQNIFQTIATPDANNPAADSTTDSLTLANGSGVSITSNGTTDTITIAATLGTDIVSGEIVDGTIVSADISDGSIANADLTNSNLTVTAGTGLTGGGAVSLGGTVTLQSSLGIDISSSEIVDGTITFADIAANSCNSGEIFKYNGSAWTCGTDADTQLSEAQVDTYVSNNGYLTSEVDGSTTNELQNLFLTIATPDANNPAADTTTDTLTLANGSGVSITSNGTTDTITIATTLGTSISNAEIDDATLTFSKLASNSCNNGEIVKFNGSAWVCGTDNDTILSEVTVESYIFDGDNTGTLSSGTLALGSLSYSGTLADANIADALTISSAGSVDDAALSTNVTKLGQTIESGEITNGTVTGADLASATIQFSNIAQNGCSTNDIMKWNGSAWACAADVTGGTVNSFETVTTSSGTSPVADSSTDTLTLTGGSGVTITGDGTTDTITVAAALGTDITSSEIVDGTIVSADISDGSIANADLANSSVTVGAGTGLTGGGAVSLGGTITLNLANDFGASIDSSEITNGTIVFADVAANGCLNGEIFKYNGSAWTCGSDLGLTSEVDGSTTNELQNLFLTIATPDANNPAADTTTDTLTLANGSGVSITSNGATDTITIAATLGTDIVSGEIVDGTIQNVDIADGTIANTKLANSSVTVSAGTGLTGGGAVSLGGTVTLNLANDFGASIDSSEITNGTITFADLGQNSCNDGDVIKWSTGSTAWTCGTDLTGGSLNTFATVSTPAGTSPVADSSADTLTFTGTGITITGNSTTDTIALALTNDFGASIDSSEITDGTIASGDILDGTVANADLANSSLTVSAGSGLINGGSVALGGTTTLNIGAGNGITVNADDIAVRAAASADALSATTSSGSGLEVLTSGVALLQGCADTQVLKWNETTDVWACADDLDTQPSEATIESYIFDADNTGTISSGTFALGSLSYTGALTDTNISDTLTVGATSTVSDSALSTNVTKLGATIESSEITDATIAAADIAPDTLDFTELKENMTLDAATTIALGANAFNINLDSTGDFVVQDAGVAVLTVNDNGTLLFKNSADNTNAFVVQDAANLPMFTVDTISNTVEIGTLVDDAADVLLVLDGVSGSDPTGIAGSIYYNITNNKFRCYQGNAWVDCVPAAYNEYAFAAGLETWTNMPAAETQFLNTPIRLQVDLTRASEFRLGISRMAGAVTAGADCRVQYATTQTGTYANLDGATGPEVDISGTAELKSSAWTAVTGAAKSDVYLRVMCKQGNGTDDPQFRNAYIQVR